ncbi:MAG: hypothetical protein HY393_01715 [Candidatus Diapherotrites archaeon]|nr:hypothetical protein [Candidatus Diapherotrites archaeon]
MPLPSPSMSERNRTFVIFLAALGIALLVNAGMGLYSGRLAEPFLDGDEAFQIPMALRVLDNELFSRDVLLLDHEQFYPAPFQWVAAVFIGIFGTIQRAYLVLSTLAFVLFISGLFFLGKTLRCNGTGFAMALFGSVVRPVLGDIGFGLSIGRLVPRELVFAFLPWIAIALLLFNRTRKTRYTLAGFLVLGILALFNPLASVHAFLVFFIAQAWLDRGLVRTSPTHFARIQGTNIVAFGIGMAPYAWWYLLHASQPASREILEYAWFHLFRPLKRDFLVWGYGLIPFLAGFFVLMGQERKSLSTLTVPLAWLGSGLLVTALFALTVYTPLQPFLMSIQFHRASAVPYLFLYAFCALLFARLFDEKGVRAKVSALALLFLLFMPWGSAFNALFPSAHNQLVLNQVCTNPVCMELYDLESRAHASPSNDWENFHALAEFARKNTSKDALFLVPPYDFSAFRAYSERSVVVVRKDGTPSVFSAGYAEKWLESYKEALNAYASNSLDAFLFLQKKAGVDFIVVDKTLNELDLPIVYENARYALYGLSFNAWAGNAVPVFFPGNFNSP